jgi:hypothetical protein
VGLPSSSRITEKNYSCAQCLAIHPNHERDMSGVLRVGTCMGHHSFFMTTRDAVREGEKLTEDDAVSLKKCMVEISQAYTLALRDHAEKKYQST